MIRFLTWLITKPITSIARRKAKRREEKLYRDFDKAYTSLSKFPRGLHRSEIAFKKVIPVKLTVKKDYTYYKFQFAAWLSYHINRRAWKKIEKQSAKMQRSQ